MVSDELVEPQNGGISKRGNTECLVDDLEETVSGKCVEPFFDCKNQGPTVWLLQSLTILRGFFIHIRWLLPIIFGEPGVKMNS